MELFEDDWGINDSPLENVEITTTILYFSKQELSDFKKLCKIGIKEYFGDDYQEKGNISDFLLKILKEKYGNKS